MAYKNFNGEAFKTKFSELDWSFVTENNDINLGFVTFLHFINKISDKHVPIKIVKKEKTKYYLSQGISMKISVMKRDKLYKQMIKAKNKQQKFIKHESCKKYRNRIIELIWQSKQTYYQHYFEQNKKDSKTIWQVIHEIISISSRKN